VVHGRERATGRRQGKGRDRLFWMEVVTPKVTDGEQRDTRKDSCVVSSAVRGVAGAKRENQKN
jgi:hypothetical protein